MGVSTDGAQTISIHKALASLDYTELEVLNQFLEISIHKALASLDAYAL